MKRIDTSDLMESYRKTRNQLLSPCEAKKEKKVGKKKKESSYFKFMKKYNNLQDNIDIFSTMDLLYYFCEKATENGIHYVVTNRAKDLAVIKRLKKNYSNEDICLMIDFIFMSNQSYLDKEITHPTVLISTWQSKLFKDSHLWKEEKYVDKQCRKKKPIREWSGNNTIEKIKIGEWGFDD